MKVLAIIGGISANSLNKRLYNEILKHNNTNLSFETFEIASLPFFSQDLENDPPQIVSQYLQTVKNADAIVFITPEYNRSFPGVLKNAIDWGSRPPGNNVWAKKPTAIMGASGGKIGTFGAQQQLRTVCSFLDMYVMHQPEFYFDASSGMSENGLTEKSVVFVQKFLSNFEQWVLKLQ